MGRNLPMIDGLGSRAGLALFALAFALAAFVGLAIWITVASVSGGVSRWLWVAIGAAGIAVMISWWGTLSRL